MQRGPQDLSSPTRDQTHAPCSLFYHSFKNFNKPINMYLFLSKLLWKARHPAHVQAHTFPHSSSLGFKKSSEPHSTSRGSRNRAWRNEQGRQHAWVGEGVQSGKTSRRSTARESVLRDLRRRLRRPIRLRRKKAESASKKKAMTIRRMYWLRNCLLHSTKRTYCKQGGI